MQTNSNIIKIFNAYFTTISFPACESDFFNEQNYLSVEAFSLELLYGFLQLEPGA